MDMCRTVAKLYRISNTKSECSRAASSRQPTGVETQRPTFVSTGDDLCGFPGGSAGKESACNAGDLGSIAGLGRSPGEGKGYPLQYSGLENSMDCKIHGVAKSWTRLSDFHPEFLKMTLKVHRSSGISSQHCLRPQWKLITPLSTVFMQARHLLLYPSGNPQTCPTAPFPDVSAGARNGCLRSKPFLRSEEFNLKLIYPLSFHKIQFKKGIPFIQKNTKQISEIKEYNLGSNFHTGGGQVTIVRKSDTTLL
ncbi:hypothetical protein MG293_000009 [Ovis ammon polii]|uniref:Uncharacterized protein n=1 Tax=Ovis ammon polii TaxID=230172 RepID=A0AAD4UMV2_OVIAM|nr:hypothetical protein MG293_000009 [Ovis ammon polii]